MTDALVLNLIVSKNRPFNSQLVADLLATKGVKKTAAQRSLDTLAAAGKLRTKVLNML
jgi:26S proteasome regulatory subunit, ATPase 3, interacting protein